MAFYSALSHRVSPSSIPRSMQPRPGSVCTRCSIPCGMVACRALQALDDQLIALGLPTSLSAKLRDFYRFM